jgi:hypothetical protein
VSPVKAVVQRPLRLLNTATSARCRSCER